MKSIRKNEIVVGLSGGLDSSISLILLKNKGYRPIGVYIKLGKWQPEFLMKNARKICQKLNVPFYILDRTKQFKTKVVKYFLTESKKILTPNPCIVCNRYVKFKALIDFADKHNIKYVATGHYPEQNYFLALLKREWISRIVFPLKNYSRSKIVSIAKANNLEFLLKQKSSQDFCFLYQKNKNIFLKNKLGENPGKILDLNGNILGEHKGLYFYTIGQRKGIGISGGPYYVVGLNKRKNVLLVSKNKQDVYKKQAKIKEINWLIEKPSFPLEVKVKIRYRSSPALAKLDYDKKSNVYNLIFQKPQLAITPGQFAVFYSVKGTSVLPLGGGEILGSS